MADPAFIELDRRATDYVREQLTGVNAFCTALLAVVEHEPGQVFTLAPFGVPPERLHRFTEGGLLAANVDPSIESLKIEQAAYLLSMLRVTPESVCIVDDFDASWDGAQGEADGYAFGSGDEMYRLFDADAPPTAIVEALQAGDTIWHGIAAICAQAPELDEDNNSEIQSLQEAAVSVVALTCTAYDGEGFIVWRRA